MFDNGLFSERSIKNDQKIEETNGFAILFYQNMEYKDRQAMSVVLVLALDVLSFKRSYSRF